MLRKKLIVCMFICLFAKQDNDLSCEKQINNETNKFHQEEKFSISQVGNVHAWMFPSQIVY